MTLEELENTLPNGLHDAKLVGLAVDEHHHTATIDVNVDVGDTPDPVYRPARLFFSGVALVVLDRPLPDTVGLWMQAGPGQPSTDPRPLLAVPEDCFLCWIFIDQTNSFIRIAAHSVSLEWLPAVTDVEASPE